MSWSGNTLTQDPKSFLKKLGKAEQLGSFPWMKKQSFDKDFEVIEVRETDEVRDLKLDPSGFYVLIGINKIEQKISVAIANPKHEVIKVFQGREPRDIWTGIFNYEEKHDLKWFTRKDHVAYLGKELKKAELALASGNVPYVQE
jgi:hypothetical protein